MNFHLRKKNTVPRELLEEFNRHRIPRNVPPFCFSPFNSLLFESDGSVFPCCHNYKYYYGSYPMDSIDKIWNGQKMQKFRKAIKKGDLSNGCDVCRFDIDSGCFDTVQSIMFDNFPVNQNGFPSMLDFKLDNTCNLECIMCDGMHSGSIRRNRENRSKLVSPYDEAFLEQLDKFIPYLHTARFSGGEPFLIDIYYRIWERIIDLNPGCILRVQTNGSILNDRIKDLLERGNFELNLSIDSFNKETYLSIRKNSDFEKAMENILYFSDYSKRKGRFFGVTICPIRSNWKELPDIVRHCNRLNAIIWFSNVWLPPQVALWSLNSRELLEIYTTLKEAILSSDNNVERDNLKIFKDFVIVLQKWHKNAIERETGNNYILVSSLRKKTLKNIKNFIDSLPLEKELKKMKTMSLSQKVKRILSGFSPNDRVLTGFINPIIENSSTVQLIDMLEGTNDKEITEIIRSFLASGN